VNLLPEASKKKIITNRKKTFGFIVYLELSKDLTTTFLVVILTQNIKSAIECTMCQRVWL